MNRHDTIIMHFDTTGSCQRKENFGQCQFEDVVIDNGANDLKQDKTFIH